jgi:hypothetical protein
MKARFPIRTKNGAARQSIIDLHAALLHIGKERISQPPRQPRLSRRALGDRIAAGNEARTSVTRRSCHLRFAGVRESEKILFGYRR